MKELNSTNLCIRINIFLWIYLILGLRCRGKGYRESGAFLLGMWNKNIGIVKNIAFYDNLDTNVYKNNIINFHSEGQSALWKICRSKKLSVVADCHTHPSTNTNQSDIDQQNPMIPEKGHIALIIPNFAKILPWKTDGVGIHIHLGGLKWRKSENNLIKFSIF